MWTILIIFISCFSLVIRSSEINLTINQNKEGNKQDINATDSISYIFAHGLGATQRQGVMLFAQYDCSLEKPIYNARWTLGSPLISFNFSDAKNDNNEYHRKEVNLGQQADIERLNMAYKLTKKKFPHYGLVFSGISRGSATILNFVALYQPPDVRALVLESPFDTITSIIKHLLHRFRIGWIPFSHKIGSKICQTNFPNIDLNGLCPLYLVDQIPYDIPILIIHSKKDRVVPIKSSRVLYMKLKLTGHQHVYLAELASGLHGKLIIGNDSNFYLYIVHAFYQKHGLPHDALLAQKGASLLSCCQPSIEEVQQRLNKRAVVDDDQEMTNEECKEEEPSHEMATKTDE